LNTTDFSYKLGDTFGLVGLMSNEISGTFWSKAQELNLSFSELKEQIITSLYLPDNPAITC